MVLTSPVCTQYGMPGAIPAGPLVMLAGLLVILALTYAGLREGVTPAILSLLISLGVFAGLWIAARAAWRALRSGPLVSVGMVLFALALVVLNAVTTFFFCLSMSV